VIELIDIGANLTNAAFRTDLSDVVDRAARHGVTTMIVTGTSVTASQAALELSRSWKGRLYATAGVHPHEADHFTPESIADLRELSSDARVVAIGETGLDFNRNFSTPEAQERAFRAQLQLATETSLPVFLHERDATARQIEILKEYREGLNKAVAHCFTGGLEELKAYLELDLYIGITGWLCDERRGQALRESVGEIPADRIMIESDAPYLLPRNNDLPPLPRPKRNEPCTLPAVLHTLASLRKEDPESLAATIRNNTRDFFGLPTA